MQILAPANIEIQDTAHCSRDCPWRLRSLGVYQCLLFDKELHLDHAGVRRAPDCIWAERRTREVQNHTYKERTE